GENSAIPPSPVGRRNQGVKIDGVPPPYADRNKNTSCREQEVSREVLQSRGIFRAAPVCDQQDDRAGGTDDDVTGVYRRPQHGIQRRSFDSRKYRIQQPSD